MSNNTKKITGDYKELWSIVQDDLKDDFKSIIWNSWVKPLVFLNYSNFTLDIQTPSELVKSRIENQYYDQIFLRAKRVFQGLNKIKFCIQIKNKSLNNINIPTDRNLNETLSSISFTDNSSRILNKNFTFKNFVIDESNELAYFSAQRVENEFNQDYNPFFIYGNVGIGKTHLLNAIAWNIKNKNRKKFIYISAERFMYQFIKSLKMNETIRFKDQFRSIDILMIDDIQFIGGKKSTQEEFFHLLDDLIGNKKQVIMTADRSPTNIKDLDYRIKSRLAGGLVVDILPTTFELRKKIIKNKIVSKKIFLDNEIINFLAENIFSSIRELEGALNKLILYSEVTNLKLSISNAQTILSDYLNNNNNERITIKDIQLQVSKYYNLQFHDLCSKNRSRHISRPRQIAMFLSKIMTETSYPDIGKLFGGKDHATVIYGVNKIKSLSENDRKVKQDIENITLILKTDKV
tara:strand:- start:2044 stop:3429 length:1386 start_codon:yes stop_codon:yes gene_type:complete